MNEKKKNYSKLYLPLYSFITLALAVLVYFITPVFTDFKGGYVYPPGPYWDENYHIASAQKYLNGVFFMEPHPPLGKLFIALGELIINPNKNIDKSSFIMSDYISNFPEGFSFAGVRFFPVLFAVFSALLFFLILSRLSVSVHYAFAFTSLFLFDNAMLVHMKGAMLEGIQIFFILAAILHFLFVIKKESGIKALDYFLLGTLAGAAASVKLNSAVILILFLFLAYEDFGPFKSLSVLSWKNMLQLAKKTALSIAGLLIVFFMVFYIHFTVASRVENGRIYMASKEYQSVLNSGQTADPLNFFIMLRDYFGYMQNYEKGVPKWDPSKLDENGSPAFAWPFGYKSINYRWSKYGSRVAYLYLQGNPLIWLTGLLGIIAAALFTGGVLLFKAPVEDRREFRIIVYFTLLYCAYMGAMLSIERVMYLYHYFIPLIFSLILAFMIFQYFFRNDMLSGDTALRNISIIFITEIICVFIFFSPLSYFIPIDSLDFRKKGMAASMEPGPGELLKQPE